MSDSIVLCGFKATGKTTLGKALAARLKRTFIDTDDLLISLHSLRKGELLTCREIHQNYGIHYFRELEKEVISSIDISSPCVIATGGGAVLDPANIELLKQIGPIFYLYTSPETILQRITSQPLPAFIDSDNFQENFWQLFVDRDRIYRTVADRTVIMDERSIDSVADEIIKGAE